jgi:beta-xylosidase
MRRCVVLRLFLAAVMALAGRFLPARAQLPPPTVSEGFGVNIHFTDPQPGEMERFREAGFRRARMDLFWGSVEREKGVYDFAAYDRLIEHLARAGARPLFILDYGNPLYDGNRAPHTDEGRAAFARFAGAAAARYKGRGVLWEIWNEPNLAQFWKPKPSADDYAALALATAKAVRAADAKATILAPGSSGFPWEFFETVFRSGLLAHIDAVSVHPTGARHRKRRRRITRGCAR